MRTQLIRSAKNCRFPSTLLLRMCTTSRHACRFVTALSGMMSQFAGAHRGACSSVRVQVQNIRPGFKWGFWMGMLNAGMETYLYSWLFGGPLWTVPANVPDREATKPASQSKRIEYPRHASLPPAPSLFITAQFQSTQSYISPALEAAGAGGSGSSGVRVPTVRVVRCVCCMHGA